MAESVRELILKHIATTLEGVTVAAGYANTLQSVQRFRQSGQVVAEVPLCVIMEGEDQIEMEGPLSGTGSLSTRKMTVNLVLIHRQDEETDARPATEVMNSLVADVQKAMLGGERFQRGGHALDTKEIGIGELNVEEGQPELVQTVAFQVQYRHRYDDPYAET